MHRWEFIEVRPAHNTATQLHGADLAWCVCMFSISSDSYAIPEGEYLTHYTTVLQPLGGS